MTEPARDLATRYNENNQELILSGAWRPRDGMDVAELREALLSAARRVSGTLYVNVKRLRHMNHAGFVELGRLLQVVSSQFPALRLKLVYASTVPWAAERMKLLARHLPGVTAEQYDSAFYPGQDVIENNHLIPVLRAQTAVLWPRERPLLALHGLKPGARFADICCGLGDFSLLVKKEFSPSLVVAVDHSKPFLDYARGVATEFGHAGIQYQYGDAASLFLPDNSFDFITARLALQIFDRPELILKELYRICAPGGRVYVTNEMMSHIHGFPRREEIAWAYDLIPGMARKLGMDVDFGSKSRPFLLDGGFEDVRVDLMEINNVNSEIEELSRVAQSWLDYVTANIAPAAGEGPEIIERLRSAMQDYLHAVKSPRGFASWSVYVASGRKPCGPG
jgi:ubiquinone/menaquinone biosynthesis C-methylase UbiE